MNENKLMALALLGVIIGASGLGFGAYSIMQVQTGALKGDDGDDGDDGADGQALSEVHYCSSQSEIVDALDKIGIGHGTIIITRNITLSSTISIDDGGHYIIRSEGPITLNRNADAETFLVTNVQSLTIEDLIIDASDITSTSTSGIKIDEGSDNSVYLQNIQISGGSEGEGIRVRSSNVWIQNCIIKGFRHGIVSDSYSAYCHFIDNSILELNASGGYIYGIYLVGSHSNTIRGNMIHDIETTDTLSVYGIRLTVSHYNTITGNIINSISATIGSAYGIYMYAGGYHTLSGNTIYDVDGSSEDGIYVHSSNYNAIVGNVLHSAGSIYVSNPANNEVDHNVIV